MLYLLGGEARVLDAVFKQHLFAAWLSVLFCSFLLANSEKLDSFISDHGG